MKFNPKLKRDKDGGVEIRLSVKFTPDEVKALGRIPDDANIDSTFSVLRGGGPDPGSKVDFYLCYLRIICHWAHIWESRDKMGDYIMQCVERRRGSKLRLESKKKKRKHR